MDPVVILWTVMSAIGVLVTTWGFMRALTTYATLADSVYKDDWELKKLAQGAMRREGIRFLVKSMFMISGLLVLADVSAVAWVSRTEIIRWALVAATSLLTIQSLTDQIDYSLIEAHKKSH
jgi:hypothetical protein